MHSREQKNYQIDSLELTWQSTRNYPVIYSESIPLMSFGATTSRTLRLAVIKCRTPPACRSRRSMSILSESHNTEQWEECDIVIVGGGPAGLALASALGSFPGCDFDC